MANTSARAAVPLSEAGRLATEDQVAQLQTLIGQDQTLLAEMGVAQPSDLQQATLAWDRGYTFDGVDTKALATATSLAQVLTKDRQYFVPYCISASRCQALIVLGYDNNETLSLVNVGRSLQAARLADAEAGLAAGRDAWQAERRVAGLSGEDFLYVGGAAGNPAGAYLVPTSLQQAQGIYADLVAAGASLSPAERAVGAVRRLDLPQFKAYAKAKSERGWHVPQMAAASAGAPAAVSVDASAAMETKPAPVAPGTKALVLAISPPVPATAGADAAADLRSVLEHDYVPAKPVDSTTFLPIWATSLLIAAMIFGGLAMRRRVKLAA